MECDVYILRQSFNITCLMRIFPKAKKIATLIFISLAVLVLPLSTAAQGPLVKKIEGECATNGNCSICDIFQQGLNVFGFLLGFLGVALFVVFVVGGWYYFIWGRGSSEKIKTGQDMIKNGFYGILFVLIAWQVVNLTLYILVGKAEKGEAYNFFDKGWNQIKCDFSKPTQSPADTIPAAPVV